MAVTSTVRIGVAPAAPGTGSYTTASFTPNNSSLLCVAAIGGGASTSLANWAPTIADSLGTLTWTQRISVTRTLTGWTYGTRIWTAPITTGASMTVTIDHGSEKIDALCVSVIDATGYDTSTPIGATASSNNIADGASSITLSASPASDSLVIAWLDVEMNTSGHATTPGTGWTELQDFGNATTLGYLQSQERTGSTSTTVAWGDTHTGAGSFFGASGGALEIKAAAGGGGGTTVKTLAATGVGG